MVNKPASSARPREVELLMRVLGELTLRARLGAALSASARFTVVAKSSMPIMVPSSSAAQAALGVWAYVPCGRPRGWAMAVVVWRRLPCGVRIGRATTSLLFLLVSLAASSFDSSTSRRARSIWRVLLIRLLGRCSKSLRQPPREFHAPA